MVPTLTFERLTASARYFAAAEALRGERSGNTMFWLSIGSVFGTTIESEEDNDWEL
jgi:hypothetical protein